MGVLKNPRNDVGMSCFGLLERRAHNLLELAGIGGTITVYFRGKETILLTWDRRDNH
jgi:hypothetical protein